MQSSGIFDRQAGPQASETATMNTSSSPSVSRTARRLVFRTLVLQFHRWTGLTVGVVLVFMALTGALIAYRPHLDPVVNRDLLTVPASIAPVPLHPLAP